MTQLSRSSLQCPDGKGGTCDILFRSDIVLLECSCSVTVLQDAQNRMFT